MEYSNITWNIILLIYSVLCLVKSQFPPDMFPEMMTGEDPPVLDTTPQTVTFTQGHTAVLPCLVMNAGDTGISWFTSNYTIISTYGNVVLNDSRVSVNTSIPGQWNLVIQNVLPSDMNVYICMVQSFPPQTKTITLIVNAPPSIDKKSLSERYVFQKGESLTVVCKVDGNPKPTVKWYAYKTMSSSMKEIKELVSSSPTLVFEKLQPSDGGIYRCEAENDVGKDMYEIFLQEVYEPRLNTTMKTIGVKIHSPTVLQCEIESNPQANIAWQRNATLLRTNWKYKIAMFAESDTKKVTELTIRGTEQSDKGEYLCIASNSYGNNNIRFYVIVEVPNTTTKSTTSTRVTTPEVSSTTETVASTSVLSVTGLPSGELGDRTTPSDEKHYANDEPKTGASQNTGYINTQSCTLILSTSTILLLLVL